MVTANLFDLPVRANWPRGLYKRFFSRGTVQKENVATENGKFDGCGRFPGGKLWATWITMVLNPRLLSSERGFIRQYESLEMQNVMYLQSGRGRTIPLTSRFFGRVLGAFGKKGMPIRPFGRLPWERKKKRSCLLNWVGAVPPGDALPNASFLTLD